MLFPIQSLIAPKVFDDRNANAYQESCEPGIANVRLVTLNGLVVKTDAQGRFHIACAAIPNPDHGSNFLMKLDERTLPTGYRVTTENPRDVRVTRGKMVKLNFGASIQKVIRVDMRDSAFIKDETTLKQKWLDQINKLPEKLKSRPTVVRVTYVAHACEDQVLAHQRLKEASNTIKRLWEGKACCHNLLLEEELVTLPSPGHKRGAK